MRFEPPRRQGRQEMRSRVISLSIPSWHPWRLGGSFPVGIAALAAILAYPTRGAPPLPDADTHHRAAQGGLGARGIDPRRRWRRAALRARRRASSARARSISSDRSAASARTSTFSGVTSIKPPVTSRLVSSSAALDAQLARLERRDQRDVARQDAEHAVRARRDDHIHALLLEDDPIGGNEFEVQCRHLPTPCPLPTREGEPIERRCMPPRISDCPRCSASPFAAMERGPGGEALYAFASSLRLLDGHLDGADLCRTPARAGRRACLRGSP